jgi:hypothetical protein
MRRRSNWWEDIIAVLGGQGLRNLLTFPQYCVLCIRIRLFFLSVCAAGAAGAAEKTGARNLF